MMTNDEHARLTAAIVRKLNGAYPHVPPIGPEFDDMIGTAVADTALFCEGIITADGERAS